jgi:predicted small secreted protein
MKSLRIVALMIAALGVVSLGSCNTSRGFGQDLQLLGGKVTSSADRNSPPPAY